MMKWPQKLGSRIGSRTYPSLAGGKLACSLSGHFHQKMGATSLAICNAPGARAGAWPQDLPASDAAPAQAEVAKLSSMRFDAGASKTKNGTS